METVDLCAHFGNTNIEGIAYHELLKAIDGTSRMLEFQGRRVLLHKPSGKKVVLDCASAYFEPPRSYYHLNGNSKCRFVRRALGTDAGEHCGRCIAACLHHGLAIRPKRITVSRDYFLK